MRKRGHVRTKTHEKPRRRVGLHTSDLARGTRCGTHYKQLNQAPLLTAANTAPALVDHG